MAQANTPETTSLPQIVIIRKTGFLLIFRLIVIQLMLVFFQLVMNIFVTLFELQRDEIIGIFNLNTILIVLYALYEIYFTIRIVLRWINEYYEIKPGEIIHKYGLIFRKQTVYKYTYIQQIDLQVGMMGKLFNYGTIILSSPVIEADIYLRNIHNPKKYLMLIRAVINESPQEDRGKFIIQG